MVSIFIRTLLIYILLTIVMKAMGKREIGELDVGELVSTLLISEIAAISIDDADMPFLNAVIPIIFIFSLEILFSFAKTKFNIFKRVMEGKSVYLINKGRIDIKELEANRITINELLSEIRIQGYASIKEIDYAILEQSGKIALIAKNEGSLEHPIIIDGVLDEELLNMISIPRDTILRKIKEEKTDIKDILLLTINDKGNINIIKRMEK